MMNCSPFYLPYENFNDYDSSFGFENIQPQ